MYLPLFIFGRKFRQSLKRIAGGTRCPHTALTQAAVLPRAAPLGGAAEGRK